MVDRDKIIREFRRIKSLGFIPSNRTHDTGVGKTFEDYLGVTENNDRDPDFAGFEVKSQRQMTQSKITLFTKSPSGPRGANAILKDSYGTPDSHFPDIKVLHTSCYGNGFNTHASGYGFKLKVDRSNEKVAFLVKNLSNGKVEDSGVYWNFEDLSSSINHKLNSLFVVVADSRRTEDGEEFHYTKATVYHEPAFDKFIDVLESGLIQFDIRIGAYKTRGRANYGKPHDHGSGFRIGRDNLPRLFEEVYEIE